MNAAVWEKFNYIQEKETSSISGINNSAQKWKKSLYNLNGTLIKNSDEDIKFMSLPKGIYIIRDNGSSKKIVIK